VTLTKFQYRHCLQYLLDAAREQPKDAPIQAFIYDQLLHDLASKYVRFYKQGKAAKVPLSKVIGVKGKLHFARFDRILFVNREGLPHNAMLQAKLGSNFLVASEETFSRADPDPELAETYVRLGLMLTIRCSTSSTTVVCGHARRAT